MHSDTVSHWRVAVRRRAFKLRQTMKANAAMRRRPHAKGHGGGPTRSLPRPELHMMSAGHQVGSSATAGASPRPAPAWLQHLQFRPLLYSTLYSTILYNTMQSVTILCNTNLYCTV